MVECVHSSTAAVCARLLLICALLYYGYVRLDMARVRFDIVATPPPFPPAAIGAPYGGAIGVGHGELHALRQGVGARV